MYRLIAQRCIIEDHSHLREPLLSKAFLAKVQNCLSLMFTPFRLSFYSDFLFQPWANPYILAIQTINEGRLDAFVTFLRVAYRNV